MCMCLNISVHNNMCSAGSEVQLDPVYWRRGGGGCV